MPDYRVYRKDEKGEIVEAQPEEAAKFLGLSEYDYNLLIRTMNVVKTICVAVGEMERPPLVWNKNMPHSLVDFVTGHVADKLKPNPGWSAEDFDWKLLYNPDGSLKYK